MINEKKDSLKEDSYLLMCGYDGSTCCFRVSESMPDQEELFTLDISKALIVNTDELLAWNSAREKAGLERDKPIHTDYIYRSMRPTFTTDSGIMREGDRIDMLKFWRDNNY